MSQTLISDRQRNVYLLVDLQAGEVVHTLPAAVVDSLRSLLAPAPQKTAVAAGAATQPGLIEEVKTHHVDVG